MKADAMLAAEMGGSDACTVLYRLPLSPSRWVGNGYK
jgi:hypothetical protein